MFYLHHTYARAHAGYPWALRVFPCEVQGATCTRGISGINPCSLCQYIKSDRCFWIFCYIPRTTDCFDDKCKHNRLFWWWACTSARTCSCVQVFAARQAGENIKTAATYKLKVQQEFTFAHLLNASQKSIRITATIYHSGHLLLERYSTANGLLLWDPPAPPPGNAYWCRSHKS